MRRVFRVSSAPWRLPSRIAPSRSGSFKQLLFLPRQGCHLGKSLGGRCGNPHYGTLRGGETRRWTDLPFSSLLTEGKTNSPGGTDPESLCNSWQARWQRARGGAEWLSQGSHHPKAIEGRDWDSWLPKLHRPTPDSFILRLRGLSSERSG